jgi:Ran GTPase-activating protein (RanGAP) involved in mRNA processing and transport
LDSAGFVDWPGVEVEEVTDSEAEGGDSEEEDEERLQERAAQELAMSLKIEQPGGDAAADEEVKAGPAKRQSSGARRAAASA